MVGRAQTPTSVDFRDFPAHLSSLKTYHIQMLSTLVSYEELGAGFEPIRNGEIFWMKNNTEKSVAQIGHTLGFHQRVKSYNHLVQNKQYMYYKKILLRRHLNGQTPGIYRRINYEPPCRAQ